jgi:ABC-type lipoprotein export system ATPase subunit
VAYNGTDIREIDMVTVRRELFGVVMQEPQLISDAILSGGEKQKIAVSAVVEEDPPVMIFVVSTSAMDAQASREFFAKLADIKREKIIIIISHDSSLQSHCDELVTV